MLCQVALKRQASCFLYALSTPLSFRVSDMTAGCSFRHSVALRQHDKQTTGNLFLPHLHQKHQINKLLLVFRLICSLSNPDFSHGPSHSVPGVCMFRVAFRGFLSPPGLQLTPLRIGICPFSISIAAHRIMPPLQFKIKAFSREMPECFVPVYSSFYPDSIPTVRPVGR